MDRVVCIAEVLSPRCSYKLAYVDGEDRDDGASATGNQPINGVQRCSEYVIQLARIYYNVSSSAYTCSRQQRPHDLSCVRELTSAVLDGM